MRYAENKNSHHIEQYFSDNRFKLK